MTDEIRNEAIEEAVENSAAEEKNATEEKDSGKKAKKAGRKRGPVSRFITRRKGNIILAALCISMVTTAGAIVSSRANEGSPYAIKVGDETICYVDNKVAADAVVKKTVSNYTPENSELKAIDATGDFTVEKAGEGDIAEEKVCSIDEAVDNVSEAAENSDDFNVVVAAVKTEEIEFTPDPIYEKDDDLFAGETIIKEEGKNGKKKVISTVTTVDGEETEKVVNSTEVLDEGKQAVIVKGTLGLPDGEDWQTYEGDPVFNDADDLIKTCKKYIGAPYKYGGKSLKYGIDCVQYVRQMFAKYGISIPNKHSQIQKVGKGVSLKDAQPGDIVCWTHHVGIYIGNGKVINATRKKGVTISSVHMNKKLVTIRRVPRN